MTTRILAGLMPCWLLTTAALCAQEPTLPAADDVKALVAKYQVERDDVVKSGVASRYPPALLDRADALAKKAEAARAGGRLLQAAEVLRQARWQLPYQAPDTPAEHVARIIGNPRLKHHAPVLAIAFSADGRQLASAGFGSVVRFWDLGNGQLVRTYDGPEDIVRLLAYSPDGKAIASAGKSAAIKVWDPATGKDLHRLTSPLGRDVKALAFSRDGKYLFAGFAPSPGKAYGGVLVAFDVATGAIKRSDSDFRGRISSLAFTPDGKILAVSDETGAVRLWQYPALVANPKQPAYWTRQHNIGAVYAVAFSPDGKTLACSGAGGVMLYNTVAPGAVFQPGNARRTIAVPGFTKALAFSRDGKALFTGVDNDSVIRYWDPETGALLGTLKGHAAGVFALAFNPGGNQLASAGADYTVRLWDFDVVLSTRDLAVHDGPVWSAGFSPDGERVVTASADRTVRVWSTVGGKALHTLTGHNAPVTAALFSPDGKYIASVGADKMLRLWDGASGAALRSGAGHTGTITALDISADGKRIVTGGADRRVKVWDADSAKEALAIDDNPSLVAAVAFRPDGKQIAVGNVDQTIALYDAATGKQQQRWTAHGGAVNCLAYSPNGHWLASGGNDALVKAWPLPNPGSDPVVLAGHAGPVSGVAFRKDSQHVASAGADTLVKLWKLEGGTGKEVQTFRGHKDWVTSVAFNRDGFHLASSSVDRTVKLWEITSREAPLVAEHTGAIETIAVSPDGKQIATGSVDRTIKVWDRTTGLELATLVGHNATVTALGYTPDSKTLISAARLGDQAFRLWDMGGFKQIPKNAEQELQFRLDAVCPYLFVAPEGKRLLAWCNMQQANVTSLIRCLDWKTGRNLFTFKEANRKVHSLAFCANGKLVATGGADGTVRLWKLEDDRAEIMPGGDWALFDKDGIGDIALSPDGATLVATSGKGEIKIADVAKRTVRHTIAGHPDADIRSCQVSPDGKRFVTAGSDNLVKCWDLDSGAELRRWVMGAPAAKARDALVANIAFTPDSRQLVTANADTTVFVLDLP